MSSKFPTIDHWHLLKTHSPFAFINIMYSLVFSYITACPFQDLRWFTLSSVIFNYFPQNLSHTSPSLWKKKHFSFHLIWPCRLTQFYNFDDPYIYIKISLANQTYWITCLVEADINKQCELKCDILRLLFCLLRSPTLPPPSLFTTWANDITCHVDAQAKNIDLFLSLVPVSICQYLLSSAVIPATPYELRLCIILLFISVLPFLPSTIYFPHNSHANKDINFLLHRKAKSFLKCCFSQPVYAIISYY